MRIFAPVIGINAIAYGDVAHFLRNLEWAHLVGGVGLFINGVRRTKKHSANAELAGKESLCQIEFELHVAGRSVGDIGMSKGVIPDGVAFLINPLANAGELVGLDPDQEKGGGRLS